VSNRLYILFDSRAATGDVADLEGTAVLVVCESESQARSFAGEYGGMACWSYAKSGKVLTDPQWEWNWFDDGGFSDVNRKGKLRTEEREVSDA
jgi:hypothetical protein